MRRSIPLEAQPERVLVPVFPGTKYGDTISASLWGSPIALFRLGRSKSAFSASSHGLARRVVEELDARPLELKFVREKGFDEPGLPDGLDVFDGFGRRVNGGEAGLQRCNAVRSGLADDPVRRISGVAVPVEVEFCGDLARGASRRHDIEVHEEGPLAGAEVLVADVAAPRRS